MTEPEQAPMQQGRDRHRFAVHIPDDAIPNGLSGWWMPGPAPSDGEPVDLSGWPDAGYVDEAVPAAPALGLEPHHRRGKERTDGESAVLAPKLATGGVVRQYAGEGCCQAAYDSDGFAHDHEVTR